MKRDLVSVLFLSPLVRLWGVSLEDKVAALAVTAATAALGDPFATLLPLLVGSSCADWLYGRSAAKRSDAFKPELAALGLHSKAGGVIVVLILRSLEFWATRNGLAELHGWIAATIAAALILEDLSSIERHRGRPIPFLSPALAFFRGILERRLPTPKPEA